jgi:hypothetical protein
MRTFGEAHYAQAESKRMVKGEWEIDYINNKPKPMEREKAGRYYNAKLDTVWLRLQCEKIKAYPIEMRRKILNYQKGKM